MPPSSRWAYQPQPAPPSPLMEPTPAPDWPQELPEPGEPAAMPDRTADPMYEEVAPPADHDMTMYHDSWYEDGYFDDEYHGCFPFYPDAEGVWLTDFMATALYRSAARNVLISREVEGIGPFGEAVFIDVMTSKSIAFTVAPGLAVNAQRFLGTDSSDNRYTFEFVYSGLYNWDETFQLTGARIDILGINFGTLFSNFDVEVGGFNRADLQSIQYQSKYNNFEWNLIVTEPTTRPRLAYRAGKGWVNEPPQGFNRSLIGGLRFAVIDEHFRFFSIGEPTVNGVSLGVDTGDYKVDTQNRMLGIQIGAVIDQRRTNAEWGVRGVVGPYINMMRQNSSVVIDARSGLPTPMPNRFERDTDERVAFLGQIGVFGRYRLLPYLSLAAGYDFMWINGMALAPEQLNFDLERSLPLNTHGHLFYQGASLGCEVIW